MLNKNFLITYFSGTGGTERIAKRMEYELLDKGHDVAMHSLDLSVHKSLKISDSIFYSVNHMIVLFPVYSFDAPKPIFEWINTLPKVQDKPSTVISVSGGGEIFANKSCRESCIQELAKKGFKVLYERMMVMPSNFAMKANDDLNMWLLKSIPNKVNEIIDDILSNKSNRAVSKKIKTKKSFGQKDHKHIKKFGLSLYATDKCSSCNWCANNCPRNNINMKNNKPVFMDNCIMCMRCIYGCPTQAITSSKYKFTILKDGYNLKKLELNMYNKELEPIDECSKGLLWIGVKRYLS